MKNSIYSISFVLFLVGGVFLSTGCDEDPSTIPSFVKIDTMIVDSTDYSTFGSIIHNIKFAWVYIDDNLQGVYQLPCKFPVIGEGVKDIRIFAGTYEFGNSSTATRYIFYQSWITTDTLVVGDTLVLTPHVSYDTAAVYQVQDFDAGFGSDFVTSSTISTGSGNYIYNQSGAGHDGLCAYIHQGIGDSLVYAIESGTAIQIPKTNGGVFLELDYKCNSPFYFDIKTSSGYRSIIGFNIKDTWNKVYINLTYPTDVTAGTDFKLIFKMVRDESIADQEVFLDNIKVIYLP